MKQPLDDRDKEKDSKKDQWRVLNLMADMTCLRRTITRISNEYHRMTLGRRRTKKEGRVLAALAKELGLEDVTTAALRRMKEEKRQRLKVRQRQLAEVWRQAESQGAEEKI